MTRNYICNLIGVDEDLKEILLILLDRIEKLETELEDVQHECGAV